MNEEALQYSYDLFKQDGYNGSIDDYKKLINEDEKALDYTFELFSNDGYDGEIEDFNTLVGVEKLNNSVDVNPETELDIEDTDSKSKDGSSESQKVIANAGIVSMYDDYVDRNKGEPANYNVDNAAGQFIIDKVAGFTSGAAGLLGGAADGVEMLIDVGAQTAIDVFNYFSDDDYTAQEREAVSGIIEKSFMIDDFLNIAAEETAKYKTIRDDDDGVGILGAFREGNYLEAIDRTISGVFEAAPSVVAAFNPVGLAIIGASSTGQHYEEKSQMEPESRGLAMMAVSTVQGGIELASEVVTRGIFRGVGKMAMLEGKALVKNVVGRLSTAMFFEGTSEVASQEANNVIDKLYSEGKIDKFYDKDGNFDTTNVLTRVFDTYLISAALGGGIQGGVELTGRQKALQADRMMSPETQAQNRKLQESITELEKVNKGMDNDQANEAIAIKKAELRRKNNINFEIIESFDKDQKVEYLNILTQQLDLEAQAKNKDLTKNEIKLNKDLTAQNNSKLNKLYNIKATELVEAKKANTLSFAESAESIGIKSTELSKDKYAARMTEILEAEKAQVQNDETLSPKQKSEAIKELDKQDASRSTGAFFDPQKGEFFINADMLIEIDQLNVGAHETLHPILNEIIGNSDKQGELIENFKKNLSKEQLAFLEADMEQRGYTDAQYNTEYLTVFSDAVANKNITYNESLFTKIGDYLMPLFRAVGFKKLKFDSGKDVYNFMREYSKAAEKGSLSKDIIGAVLKETDGKGVGAISLTGEIQQSKSVVDLKQDLESLNDREFEFSEPAEFDSQVSNLELKIKQAEKIKAKGQSTSLKKTVTAKQTASSEKVQKLYEEKKKGYQAEIIKEFEPIISNIAGNPKLQKLPGYDKGALVDALTLDPQGLVDMINRYEKDVGAKKRASEGVKVPLAGFVNKYLRTRSISIFDKTLKKNFDESLDKAAKVAAEDTSSAPAKDVRLIKATKILNPKQLARAKEIIIDTPIDSKNLSYRKLKGITREITSELTGIPANKIGFPTKNLSQGQTTTAAMFISNNVDYIRNTLPEGAVLEGASEKLIETSTGVPDKMLKAFYVKNKRGKNLSPYILRKSLTSNEILEEIGRPRGGKPVPIDPRTPRGAVIKGIIDIVDKNITNELVRTEKDLTPQQRVDTGAGRGEAVFSRAVLKKESGEVLEKVSNAKNIQQTAKEVGIKNKITVSQENLTSKQDSILNKIKEAFIPSFVFQAAMFASPGRWNRRGRIIKGKFIPLSKLLGGKKYFKKRDGALIKEDSSAYKKALKDGDFLPARGGLYYGTSDPRYKEALKAAKENDSRYTDIEKSKRVNPPETGLTEDFIKSKEQISKDNMDTLESFAYVLQDAVHEYGMPIEDAALFIASSYQATSGLIKIAAPFKYVSKKFEYALTGKSDQRKGNKYREEHNPPASVIGSNLIWAVANNKVVEIMPYIKENYYQTQLSKKDDAKLDAAKLDSTMPKGFSILDNSAIRFIKAGIDLNSIIDPLTGETIAQINDVGIPDSVYDSYSETEKLVISTYQNNILTERIINPDFNIKGLIKEYLKLVPDKAKAAESNNNQLDPIMSYSKAITVQEGIDALAKTDKAFDIARDLNAPVKKIRVFDFDDTLARTKSKIGYTMLDGTEGKIDAETFAKDASAMEAEGAIWDFSEFSKVMDGKKGPLFEVAKKIQETRGSEDIFVLTARPADAAGPIKEFLGSLGLNIPLKNITGLGDGSPQAKAGWIVGKAADGYNDFYFTDDATGNVKAVKEALSLLDVKSKVQQAKIQFSNTIDKEFNSIIENKTGIEANKNYASVKADLIGRKKGRFNFFIPPSAEDFLGLLYKTLGKGTIGDTQMKWYKKHLLDPYARAMGSISRDRNALSRNFRALKKNLKVIPRDLKKKVKDSEFTREQAVRVYMWSQMGNDVPGLSKADMKELVDMVESDPQLKLFAQEIIKLNKGRDYASPKEGWVTGTITTDLLESLNTTGRKQYLEQWQQNVDIIFSEKNLNKMEAAYGKSYRLAMENILGRMKTGRNRSYGTDTLTGRLTDWLTGSIGAIMFFNTRSAVLQTLSAVNFINFGDNNIFAAGKAFANQGQYWSDFKKLFNSDFLTERRDGLKINVNEADIADIAKENGIRGVINKLLKLGFTPTQVADSFAIASGGATFYRNRLKSLIKEGMDPVAAEKQAMLDFRETAEESQQSSRPDKISSQQAGPLGRVVLAFANTPAQYARLIKKAASDLKNGRGDTKTNLSKIVYYGVAQNLLFNAMQQALFAISFDEEEEVNDKSVKIVNGMVDSIARGTGIAGAIFTVVKNASMRLMKENEKSNPKYEEAALELLKISPPISSKIQKIRSAGRSASWDMDDMKNKGWSLDNPAYLAGGNIVSAATNIPLDRVVKKLNNVVASGQEEIAVYKRIALLAGWSEWELGLSKSKSKKTKSTTRSRGRRRTRRETRRRN